MTANRSGLNLLLVEDSKADARLLEILLLDSGADVDIEHVASMQAAVRALADHDFDIALLDLGLPDGFGLENITRIAGLAPSLPILIMTGLDDAQTAEAAQRHGASGYLVKGQIEQGEELLAHIRAAIAEPGADDAAGLAPGASQGMETDLSGAITAWGEDAVTITGFAAQDMLGRPMLDLIPASRRDEVALIDGRIRAGESLREFETLRLHRDGSQREVSLSVWPRYDAAGTVIGSRTLMRDITELKRDRADAMQLAAIVASTDDAIIATTLEGIITHWNPGAEATLGRAAESMLGRPFLDLVPPQLSGRAAAMMQRARRGLASPRFDGELLHEQGHIMPMSISLSPIRDRAGGLVGAAILASDITERRRAQDALEREIDEHEAANRELREAQDQLVQSEKLASLGGLVAGIAHEINTPVGVGVTAASHLRGKLEALRDSLAAGNLKRSQLDAFMTGADQATQIILTNLERAAQLIQSFKQVAVDQSSSETRRFNLRRYLDEILLSLRPNLKNRSVAVVIDCPPELEIDSVPGAYSQIFTNLIMNSLIHAYGDTGQGNHDPDQHGNGNDHKTGTIRIQAAECADGLELIYSDDGCGMDAATRDRIFDPFFTTRRGQGGSGLGMHIVFNLITQKLGGRLQVDTQPGQGMRLRMQLPLAGAAPNQASNDSGAADGTASGNVK